MSRRPVRPSALLRASATAIAAAAVLGAVGLSSAAHADSDLQPALTAQNHPITDVPGLVNGRELGAFTGLGGQRVDASRLIRSESLDKVTAAGAQTLASEYHVDLVVDLRTPDQVAAKPDVAIPGAQEVHISMFGADGDYSDDTAMYHDLVDKGYVDATDRGPMITAYAQVLQILATHTSGTVLVHCSHGMDRTGTVVDLLDRVLGVGSADILHDYLLSNTQLGVTWATPALLQGTFEHDVATKYAGMDSYLSRTIGVTADEEAALRARFLVSDDASASAITVDGVTVPLDAAATTAGATVTAPVATISDTDVHVSTTDPSARSTVAVQGDTAVVTVTAEDGTTTTTYRVHVARPTLTLGAHGALTPGSTVTVGSSGLTPGASYQVVVHSTPQVLGRVTAAQDGSVSASVTLPADLAPGAHTLFLADATGTAVSDPLALTVVSATTTAASGSVAGTATTAAVGPSVATGGTVAGGRDDAPWLALGGLGALVLGGTGALRIRSRRRAGR
ncbi:tyrosine-protein phosphatase [Curtobacterium sp. MCBA15_012]|uniref:tyrosine-protein phosphatase n=1 Tax=Curtobacterium sp. MCBA15_012 TaxID=1898738 RepID=UPI0008DE5AD0|nr:tyrosine-protein phosphatase [Curtobacterium sp. MCBA15_012]WIA99581.1 tyrosine-protein phosphatase [Curtobacterium sp. MCBA15_012]